MRETNQQSYGIPFPGTFMLNTQGVVTSRFFEQAYQERSTVGSIMARLGNKVEVQATTLSSPQLETTSFATDSTVAPGCNSLWSSIGQREGFTCTRQALPGTSRSLSRYSHSPDFSPGARCIRHPRTIVSSR